MKSIDIQQINYATPIFNVYFFISGHQKDSIYDLRDGLFLPSKPTFDLYTNNFWRIDFSLIL